MNFYFHVSDLLDGFENTDLIERILSLFLGELAHFAHFDLFDMELTWDKLIVMAIHPSDRHDETFLLVYQ